MLLFFKDSGGGLRVDMRLGAYESSCIVLDFFRNLLGLNLPFSVALRKSGYLLIVKSPSNYSDER